MASPHFFQNFFLLFLFHFPGFQTNCLFGSFLFLMFLYIYIYVCVHMHNKKKFKQTKETIEMKYSYH